MSRSQLELIIEDRFGFEQALPGYVAEYRFATSVLHPITGKPRQYRFDFAWPRRRVAVEAEGGSWSGGRHVRGAGYAEDCRKYSLAALLGWIVLRWTTDTVREDWGECMANLEAALATREHVTLPDNADERRFWDRVQRGGKEECWPWQRARNEAGYGQFKMGGVQHGAHRISWMITRGPIPSGLYICHHCDNPSCVNPAHLFLGTPRENSADMVRKGRCPPQHGEAGHNSKLTGDEVRRICVLLSGDATQQAIADKFRVSQSLISAINNGLVWGWQTGRGKEASK